MTPHSRDTLRPSFENSLALKERAQAALKRRGRREDRVRAAPAVSCAKVDKKAAHEHTGSAEAVRPSLRNGFTTYIVLSPVRPKLACHRRPQEARAPCELDTCHRGVRTTRLRRPPRPRSSVAASASIASHRALRDVRNAPLVGWDARNKQLSWVKSKAEYFSRRGWTGFRTRR
jgi:hypothetical protein